MVAIIGILAAVAIPAYQTYQKNAKIGVIEGSINQITKAWNACIALSPFGTCDTIDINSTLKAQPGATITTGTNGTSAVCYKVQNDITMTISGCIQLDGEGNTTTKSTKTNIGDTTDAVYNSTTGACTTL